jgi:hypothetical protein
LIGLALGVDFLDIFFGLEPLGLIHHISRFHQPPDKQPEAILAEGSRIVKPQIAIKKPSVLQPMALLLQSG